MYESPAAHGNVLASSPGMCRAVLTDRYHFSALRLQTAFTPTYVITPKVTVPTDSQQQILLEQTSIHTAIKHILEKITAAKSDLNARQDHTCVVALQCSLASKFVGSLLTWFQHGQVRWQHA